MSRQNAVEHTSRREQLGWSFYDWANSAFPTVVVTVFLGPYLTTVTRAAADASGFVYPFGFQTYTNALLPYLVPLSVFLPSVFSPVLGFVYLLGSPVRAAAFFPYVVSLSVLLQLVFLPVLGAVADSSQRKKSLLALFAYVGAFATMGLFFVQGSNYLLGGALFVVANLAFGAAVVLYNAFLPEIATPDERNSVSSIGWALGYLGGGLLLALNVLLVFNAPSLGLSTGDAVRIAFVSAGLWWAIFTVIPLLALKNRRPAKPLPRGANPLTVGFTQLRRTIGSARQYPQTLLFLLAYLFYNDGIQTVIALSAAFGQEELGLSLNTIVSAILMVQFVAFLGALLFNQIAKLVGTRLAIALSLVIWTATLGYAYAFLQTGAQFFAMAAVIALVLGGSQALSRSVYSLMIPKGQEAEYFSLYEVSERGTSWLGPLLAGLALQLTNSYRIAIVSLVIFFLIGLALLLLTDLRRAIVEAGNQPPANT